MEAEYTPIFLEEKNGHTKGDWMHTDARISARIIPFAYTSDLGLLRVIVDNLDTAAGVLEKQDLMVRRTIDAIEVVPNRPCGLLDVLLLLAEHDINVELTGIIPGIYQG